MRTRTSWLGLLLMAGMALAPSAVRAQTYTPPDPVWPLPIYHDRPEEGGFFVSAEFMLFRQTNPLAHQMIARRGFVDLDGSVVADLHGQVIEPFPSGTPPFILPGPISPGSFVGNGQEALFADDAGGPRTYQPGYQITAGWRFRSGFVLETSWLGLVEAKYAAVASIVPKDFNPGINLENTFLFSPVFNFPNDFVGPQFKIALGNPNALFGIWNGASIMSIEFVQRFDQWDITGRVPVYEGDNCRCYGLVGSRLAWFWERFRWRTVSEDFSGNAGQDDVALYNNIVSNRMYGAHVGGGTEWRLGDTPMGTFSASLDLQAALLLDVVKERASYERGDFETGSKRARTDYTVVPELQAQAALWWYPIEGIQLKVGYNVMGFFNTVASPNPVSFNYGGLDPPWEKGIFRLLDGWDAGIGIIF